MIGSLSLHPSIRGAFIIPSNFWATCPGTFALKPHTIEILLGSQDKSESCSYPAQVIPHCQWNDWIVNFIFNLFIHCKVTMTEDKYAIWHFSTDVFKPMGYQSSSKGSSERGCRLTPLLWKEMCGCFTEPAVYGQGLIEHDHPGCLLHGIDRSAIRVLLPAYSLALSGSSVIDTNLLTVWWADSLG